MKRNLSLNVFYHSLCIHHPISTFTHFFFSWTQCIVLNLNGNFQKILSLSNVIIICIVLQGKLTGFSSPIIHVFNKTAGSITNNRIPKRPNVLLLGDSTGDVHMADGATIDDPTGQLGTVLRIGFLNESVRYAFFLRHICECIHQTKLFTEKTIYPLKVTTSI